MGKGSPLYADREWLRAEDALSGECSAQSCGGSSFEDAPFPICAQHYMQIIRHFEAYKSAVAIDSLPWGEAPKPKREGWVYFVQFADRVKIGYTEDPRRRLKGLPYDEVLCIMRGSRELEQQWHTQFAGLRVTGEWFFAHSSLLDSIPRQIDYVI